MIKKTILIMLCCFLFIMSISCGSNESDEASQGASQDNKDESLVTLKVYMIGDEAIGSNGSFFFSAYSMGEMRGRTLQWGNAGHIYYEAMKKFEKETGVTLEVTYFDYSEDLFLQLESDIQNHTMPDVIVGDGTTENYNVYKYMNSDYLVELDSFLEGERDTYYKQVLTGGEMEGRQYIFPLMFNLNVMLASENVFINEDIEIYSGESYTGIMKELMNLLERTRDRKDVAGISQLSNHMPNYPFTIFESASGVSLIDYTAEKVIVDKEYISLLYDFEKARLMQEYGDSWKDSVAFATANNNVLPYQDSKSDYFRGLMFEDMFFQDIYDLNIILLEGGGYATVEYHSALAQAAYFNSRYDDMNDDLVCIGIPTYMDGSSYTANVNIYAGITAGCDDPEGAFKFIKYLADSEIPWEMGLSINKQNTEKMIEDRKNSIYTLYPYIGTYDPEMEGVDETWKGDPYIINEMDDELCGYFLKILENIGVTTLPDGNVKLIVYNHILDGILHDKTKEEVYDNIYEELNTYIDTEICS